MTGLPTQAVLRSARERLQSIGADLLGAEATATPAAREHIRLARANLAGAAAIITGVLRNRVDVAGERDAA